MRNKANLRRGEKGQILVWVIAIMVLAALVISPFLASAYTTLHTSSVRQERMQELYAADTGIEDALQWLISEGNNITITKPGNPTLPPGNYSTTATATYTLTDTVNNCQVDVTVARDLRPPEKGNYTYRVDATATNKDNHAHVTVRVYVSPTGDWSTWSKQPGPPQIIVSPNPSNNPFCYAMGSLKDEFEVDLKQSDVTGDVYVNGPLNLIGGNNRVDGNVYSVGDLTLSEGSIVKGNVSVTGNLVLEQQAIIEGNAWGNKSITVDCGNGIWGYAFAQADINVSSSDGSIGRSAYANNNVNVTGTINQSAFAHNSITGSGTIEGWARYVNNLEPTVQVGSSQQLTEGEWVALVGTVPQPKMPQFGPAPSNPEAVYIGNASTGPTLPSQQIKGKNPVPLGPCVIEGNLEVKDTLMLTGTVYVTGTLTLDNGCVVTTGTTTPDTPAVLVADGLVHIYGNVVAQVDQAMPLIMSVNSDIICWNNSVIHAALFAPNGTVWVHNGAQVDGAIVAKKISALKDNGQTKKTIIVYNPAVQNIPGLPYANIEGPPETHEEPTDVDVESRQPFGLNVDSYIVLE